MSKKSYIKIIITFLIPFFTFKAITEYYGANPELMFDNIATVIFLFIIMFKYHKWKFSKFSMYSIFFALGLHHSKLYGQVYYTIQFDMIVHFVATFAIAMITYQLLKPYHKSLFNLAMYTILISLGMGCLLEITEYIGYNVIGEGEGILGFGKGDATGWNEQALDIIWDIICNTLGAITATIISLIKYRNKKINHKLSKNRLLLLQS